MHLRKFIFISVFLFSLPFRCFSLDAEISKIYVTVSISPQKELVEALGGDKVKVSVMVPYGANPHTYELKPSQLVLLSKSSMYVKVGSPLEFELAWMDRLVKINSGMLVVDMSKGISLIRADQMEDDGHGHGDLKEKLLFDPHVWLSPKNLKICAENVFKGLVRKDPKNEKYYGSNKADYLKKLDRIDREIDKQLKPMKNGKFIVFHPSFGYFARDYGLTQIPIQFKGKDPTAKDIKEIIDLAQKESIKVIFASPQFSTASARTIASQIGVKVVLIDPLAGNLLENLESIAKAFAQSMN